MRALFTTQPATGTFRPLVPFARALVGAGHEVAFACSPSFRPQIEAAGFEMFPAGIDWVVAEMTRAFPEAPPPGPARAAWIPTLWRLITARATVPDLLAIADPSHLAPAVAGDRGVGGDRFAFPFATIESLLPLPDGRVLVLNDNNFPFGRGRHAGAPDDSELIEVQPGPSPVAR